MRVLAVTNLLPRPDRPQAGRFNVQLFAALARQGAGPGSRAVCLVPEWRVWRWPRIRCWTSPAATAGGSAGFAVTYAPVGYVPWLGRTWNAMTYAGSLHALAPLARAADQVLVPWLYPDGVAVLRVLGTGTRAPVWLMALGTDTLHLRHPARCRQVVEACRRAAGVICVGRRLADRLTAAGVPPSQVHVVPNGVDASRFCHRPRAAALQALGAAATSLQALLDAQSAGAPVVLAVGNLVPVKGPDLLIAAFARLTRPPEGGPLPWLLLIGAGPLQRRLQALAARFGIADRVVFAGSRPHAEVALWMNVADVLALSSRNEGMPNVVLEALASGLPVVASDVGDCAEMVLGEPAARITPREDVAALAEALGDVLAASPDREALARRQGRRTWDDQAGDILRLMGGTT